MTTQGVNGAAVATAAAGALLIWSGIRGNRVTVALKEIISGQAPSGAEAYPLSAWTPGAGVSATVGGQLGPGSPAGSVTGQAIAADAQQYVGHPYLFGGAPGMSGQQPWDCSSFVNWVLGHDLRLAIPGSATYNGSVHGPNTLLYLAWPGAVTIGHDGNQAAPGDLAVWQTHMGIAIGGGKMISARSANSNPPTGEDTINGDIPGEVLFIRRLKAATGGQPTLGDVRARVRGATGG